VNIPFELIKLLAIGVVLFLAFAWCRTILAQLPEDIRRLRHSTMGSDGRAIVLGWLITALVLALVAVLVGPRLARFVSYLR
jgi:Na+/H+ antiporter NhaD/arsenite permease-like protein